MNASDVIRKMARGFCVLGLLGLAFVSAFAIAHYTFGVPVHQGHSQGLASPTLVARTLILLAAASGGFAVLGGVVLFYGVPRMNRR